MLYKSILAITCGIILVAVMGCNHRQMKFDQVKWKEHPDLAFSPPYREMMLVDLTTNHKLVGLKYDEAIRMLGGPTTHDSNQLVYLITIKYGSDIDPVYVKNLLLSFSRDSTITNYKVEEWDKDRQETGRR